MDEHDFDGDRPRQLLVCTYGEDCGAALKRRDGSAQGLADALKAARTAAGLKRTLYVTKTGCMGWCAYAPVAQLLPEGLVVRDLAVADAAQVVAACARGGAGLETHRVWDFGVSRAENEARRAGGKA
jgi:(2Fe-2S) ferredoxin